MLYIESRLVPIALLASAAPPTPGNARDWLTSTVTTWLTSTSTLEPSIRPRLCAKLVNVSGACQQRRNRWIEEPIVMTFDDVDESVFDQLMRPAPVAL